MTLSATEQDQENTRLKGIWDKQAGGYDKKMGWWERRLFGPDNRPWVCSRASGDVLEVAIGTGLNLPLYPDDVKLTGIDLSPGMLEIARQRAGEPGHDVDLQTGDAHHLPFRDGSFDTVLCTFSLCNIPDVEQAVSEMKRVLKPGGKLLLVDHIRSSVKPVYWFQKGVEMLSLRYEGDHMTRRPSTTVESLGFEISERERFRMGIVERLVAIKPTDAA